jgi:hypothetical protein
MLLYWEATFIQGAALILVLPNVPGATFISRSTSIVVDEALNDLMGHFTYTGTSSVGFQGKTFPIIALQPNLTWRYLKLLHEIDLYSAMGS